MGRYEVDRLPIVKRFPLLPQFAGKQKPSPLISVLLQPVDGGSINPEPFGDGRFAQTFGPKLGDRLFGRLERGALRLELADDVLQVTTRPGQPDDRLAHDIDALGYLS